MPHGLSARPRHADAGAGQAARLPQHPSAVRRVPLEQLGIADRDERIQALESVLEMPRPLLRYRPRAAAGRAAARPAGDDAPRPGTDPAAA